VRRIAAEAAPAVDEAALARQIEQVLHETTTAPAVGSPGLDEAAVRRIVAESAPPLEDMAKQIEHFLREGPTAPATASSGGMKEEAVRELLAEEVARRADPAKLVRTPEFQDALEKRFKELLIREFKKRKKK
jgi:hypothetical protein